MTMTTMEPQSNVPAVRQAADLSVAAGRAMPTLKNLIESQKDKLAMVLPKHLTPERLMRVVLVAVSKSKDLQECTIGSILQCVMTSAQLGLDCSGVLGSAYMVPFNNRNTGQKEAQFIPGYRGLIDLARRSGEIEDITAHCVYAEDDFSLELGAEPKLIHRPNLQASRADENIVGAYMVAYLKGNTRPHVEFVPRGDIEKVRKSSRAKFGPWVDWFAEMCRKTAIRRGIKYLPMSIELSDAISLDDQQYETRVESAETSSGRARLNDRITSRPTDERQTFEPLPDASEQIERQEADQHGDGPNADGADSQPPEGADVSTWATTVEACGAAAQDIGLSPSDLGTRLNLWTIAAGAKGKEDKKTTIEQRRALVAAVVAGKLGADGKIQ